jgi:hypothetical protein
MPPFASVGTGKNDFRDAEAFAESVQRPTVRVVATRTAEQLDLQAVDREHSRLLSECKAIVNESRAFLLDRGIAVAKGLRRLRMALPSMLARRTHALSSPPLECQIATGIGGADMLDRIDWTALAEQLGMLTETGEQYSGGDAERALEVLIGERAIRETVEHCIARAPGGTLALNFLMLLRPWTAMACCYDIWKSSRPIEERRDAVWLLRVVADHRALNWVGEFLDDEDDAVQSWGIGVLDQLVWRDLVLPEEAESLLIRAESHANPMVREKAASIRGFLRRNEARGEWMRKFNELHPPISG